MNPLTEERIRPHLAAAFVALIALLLYARTVGYEYVWDDMAYLSDARTYTGLEGAVKAFTEPFFIAIYYRPVATFSFVFSGLPSVQHFINTLLHAINAALVFCCARALMPRAVSGSTAGVWAPALAALAFAVHPAAVEAVAWVSGRYDTLMCTFVLATCLAALGGEVMRKRLVLVFFLFACAMGCKESAVGLLVALPILLLLKWRLAGMEAAQIKAQTGGLVCVLLALALAVALYIAVRLAVIRVMFADDAELAFGGGSVLDRLNVAALAVTALVQLIVSPMSHSAPLHPVEYESSLGLLPQTAIVSTCVLALLALAFWKKTRFNFPLAFLAALAMSWPVLHLFGLPNGDNIISDRYALAPLALLLMALAAVAGCALVQTAFPGGKRIAACAGAICMLWIGALLAYSSATIPLWRDDSTLWAFAHKQAPQSRLAHRNYIAALARQNRWSEADAAMRHLVNTFDEESLVDIGNWILILARLGNYDGGRELFAHAEETWENVRERDARSESVFYGNMGILEFHAGNMAMAERYLVKSLQAERMNSRFAPLLTKVRAMRDSEKSAVLAQES